MPNPKLDLLPRSAGFKGSFRQLQRLKKLVIKQAAKEGSGMRPRHHRAYKLVDQIIDKASADLDYALEVKQWISKGSTVLLRDAILQPVGCDPNQLNDFNAFVLLDKLGISLRERKEAVNG
jgi:hypothetical protein